MELREGEVPWFHASGTVEKLLESISHGVGSTLRRDSVKQLLESYLNLYETHEDFTKTANQDYEDLQCSLQNRIDQLESELFELHRDIEIYRDQFRGTPPEGA